MECTTGVRIAPMGARWTWNTLADSACSHHIPSLAPAVALPAPRHDRRRTGAAGSPPGGFPFVELTSRGCEMGGGAGQGVSHANGRGLRLVMPGLDPGIHRKEALRSRRWIAGA